MPGLNLLCIALMECFQIPVVLHIALHSLWMYWIQYVHPPHETEQDAIGKLGQSYFFCMLMSVDIWKTDITTTELFVHILLLFTGIFWIIQPWNITVHIHYHIYVAVTRCRIRGFGHFYIDCWLGDLLVNFKGYYFQQQFHFVIKPWCELAFWQWADLADLVEGVLAITIGVLEVVMSRECAVDVPCDDSLLGRVLKKETQTQRVQ